MKKHKKLFVIMLLILTFAILCGFGIYFYKQSQTKPEVKKLINQGYVNTGRITTQDEINAGGGIACAAMMPECGVCVGIAVDGYCYEKK